MAVDVGIKGAIITRGLGRSACFGMITADPFGLVCLAIVPPRSLEAGSIPLEPGEIQDFYQPVPPEYVEGTLADPRVWNKKKARIKIFSDKFKIDKEYLVTEDKAKMIVKVLNIINATRSNMKVAITEVKRITTRAIVKVSNIRKKYWS